MTPPTIPPALRALAADCGVLLDHVDGLGCAHRADPDVLLAVLRASDEALESTLRTASDAGAALRQRQHARADRVLEPVTVVAEGTRGRIVVRLRPEDKELECRLDFEDGATADWRVHASELDDCHTETIGRRTTGTEVCVGTFPLPVDARVGYHQLTVRVRGRVRHGLVIVPPARGARARFGDDWRGFGVVAPLFSLHSAHSWGAGDITDLDQLGRIVAPDQASVVATLPLLSGFDGDDFEASPYRPLSRQFWHERWIDVSRVPELGAPAAREHFERLHAQRASWVHDRVVDGAAATRAKRELLEVLANVQDRAGSAREAQRRAFVLRRPEVVDYARFRAAGERFGMDWRRWPASARGGLLRWNDVDPRVLHYHTYVQWIADEQMGELAQQYAQRGQTLALDLPVGVHPCGYDAWRHREQYALNVSVGAPPDPLAPAGQVWGVPPLRAEAVRADGHHQLRAALAFHLRVAGLLRIDHVMGLQRLYWVPDGAAATDGLYVQMPLDELMAVVAIEAYRHRADIVGEDLGTVDPAVRSAMEDAGLRRMCVAQFGLDPDADPPIAAPPAGSVASFGSHDLPPFASWWSGADLDERVALDLMDRHAADATNAQRAPHRAVLAPTGTPAADALGALHANYAASDAGLVLVALDDLLGEVESVNVPGTYLERPNWARRTEPDLETLATDPALHAPLQALRRSRGPASVRSDTVGGHAARTVPGVTRLTDDDLHLFNEGRHFRLYDKLGGHPMTVDDVEGCYFAVWAPNAEHVSVVGDFNGWDGTQHPLSPRGSSGIWEGFAPDVESGVKYKYRIRPRAGGADRDKADPFGRAAEIPPLTASKVWRASHQWRDDSWMSARHERQGLAHPMSIYEVHLGSWRRVPEDGNRSLTYAELAARLVEHVQAHGFTHVELLPVMEHPFYGSWGYQATGFFAPTSRYGTPDEFAAFVDTLHRAGIGVILDWVPSHFPADAFALAEFDGTHLFEHADERQRVHPDWKSWIFNYGRNEVRSFLISNAIFWLEQFHIDALRVDAVASMLYLDYSRKPGEWVPNQFGGNENLEAISLLQECNTEVYRAFPDAATIAEESTAWPGVSRPVDSGGLGFGFKWDMGWMHDTLQYLGRDAVHRRWHHDELTFRAVYANTEHFVLPLSHDEVVHGKGSLLDRMAGDEWQKFANLRLLYGYQYTQPGKKLLFMGCEFAQRSEWNHDTSLDWHLLDEPAHAGVARWVAQLNSLYRGTAALHRDDLGGREFEWITGDDREHSVYGWLRHDGVGGTLAVVMNGTPIPRDDHRIGLPIAGEWHVVANSDASEFGGSGRGSATVATEPVVWHGRAHSARLSIPPLGLLILAPDRPMT